MNSTPQELKLLDSTTTTTTTTDNTPTATISHQQQHQPSQQQQLIASAVTPSLVTVLTQSPLPSSSSPTCPNNNNHIFVVDNDNDSSFDANFDEDRKIVQMVSGLTHTFLLDKKGRVFGDLPNSLFQPLSSPSSPSSSLSQEQQLQQLQREQVNKFINNDKNKNSKNSSNDTTKTIQWRHAKWFDDKHICMILSGYYYLILVSTTTSGETSEMMNNNNNNNNNKVTFYHFDYRNHSKISMRRWTSDEVPPLRHLLSSPTTTNTYNCNGENSPISPISPSTRSLLLSPPQACLSNHMASGAYHTIVLTHESRNNCYGFIHSPFQAPTYDELPTVSHQNLFMQVHVQKRVLPHLNHPLLTHERIVQVVAGYRMTFLLSDRGELFVCGVNVDGCLFLGRTSASESLKRVTGLKGVVRRVWCGYRHAMIQLTDGRYFVCGANDQQQLSFVDSHHGHHQCDHGHHAAAVVDHHGSGHDSSHHHQMTMIVQPVQVTLPEHTTHVELSGFRTLFTTSTGRVYCYGGQPQHKHLEENIGNPSLSTNTFCGSNSSPAVVSSPVATNSAVLVMEQPPSMMMMTASANHRANGNGSRSDDGDDEDAQCTTMTAEEDPARRMQQRPSQSQQSQNVLRMTSGGLAAQFYYTERSPDYDHLAPQLHLAVDLKSV